MFLASMYTC